MDHIVSEYDAADQIAGVQDFRRTAQCAADANGEYDPGAFVPPPGQQWTTESAEAFILLHASAVADAMTDLERTLRHEYPDGMLEIYTYTAWTLVRYFSTRSSREGQPLGFVSVRTRNGLTASGTVLVRWRDGHVLIERHPPIWG